MLLAARTSVRTAAASGCTTRRLALAHARRRRDLDTGQRRQWQRGVVQRLRRSAALLLPRTCDGHRDVGHAPPALLLRVVAICSSVPQCNAGAPSRSRIRRPPPTCGAAQAAMVSASSRQRATRRAALALAAAASARRRVPHTQRWQSTRTRRLTTAQGYGKDVRTRRKARKRTARCQRHDRD